MRSKDGGHNIIETVIQEEHEVELSLQRPRPQPPMKMASTSGRNYHDRYSYAGYEPERDFKDYTRDRELMLQRQPRNNSYTARYILIFSYDENSEPR